MYLFYLIFYIIIKTYPFRVILLFFQCYYFCFLLYVVLTQGHPQGHPPTPILHPSRQGLIHASGCSLSPVASPSVQEESEESPGWRQTRKRTQLANIWGPHICYCSWPGSDFPIVPTMSLEGWRKRVEEQMLEMLLTQKSKGISYQKAWFTDTHW